MYFKDIKEVQGTSMKIGKVVRYSENFVKLQRPSQKLSKLINKMSSTKCIEKKN